MSTTLKTSHFEIPYWAGTDKPQLAVDVASMANKIDDAIYNNIPDVSEINNSIADLQQLKADKTTTTAMQAEINKIIDYYDFSKNTGKINILQTSQTNLYTAVTSDLKYAMNKDYTYGKIYGWVWVDVDSNCTVNNIEIPTSLQVAPPIDGISYQIGTGAMQENWTATKEHYKNNFWVAYLKVKENGAISIILGGAVSVKGGTIRAGLPSSLYNFKNFGDI